MTASCAGSTPLRRAARTQESVGGNAAPRPQILSGSPETRHTLFRIVWFGVNILLLFSLLAVMWSSAWEYSTRRYLKGFSDAIIPLSSSPTQKIQAILNWMSHTPTRIGQAPASLTDDRDPTDTLNYDSLLRVCGTATNAFINLADSGGLAARRLLLLDANGTTIHVVAEVLINGRWIVVDPTSRAIFRGPDGGMLTRADLVKPAIFAAATSKIPGYDPDYVFDRSVHIRVARLGLAGRVLGRVLDRFLPNWEGSAALSLIVERESLGMTVFFTLAALLLLLLRTSLRWYGAARLGVRPSRIRHSLRRLGQLLLEPTD
jgi:hypothetical protein